jgi:hypothetical protein
MHIALAGVMVDEMLIREQSWRTGPGTPYLQGCAAGTRLSILEEEKDIKHVFLTSRLAVKLEGPLLSRASAILLQELKQAKPRTDHASECAAKLMQQMRRDREQVRVAQEMRAEFRWIIFTVLLLAAFVVVAFWLYLPDSAIGVCSSLRRFPPFAPD